MFWDTGHSHLRFSEQFTDLVLPAVCESFHCSTSPTVFSAARLLNFNHTGGCVGLSSCDFNLDFP